MKVYNVNNRNAYDVNVRSTFASQMMGREGLSKFCSVMDLPPPITKAPYTRMMKAISSTAVIKAEAAMKDSANKLVRIGHNEHP